MDSLIAAAARQLAGGDALGALRFIALREDPPALALRGIAMAQLGEHPRARDLLRRAGRAFGAQEVLERARCVVAEAEVALAMRDLRGSPRALAAAVTLLEARGDHGNAQQARLIALRRLVLLGRLEEAGAALDAIDARAITPALAAIAALVRAEIALRSLRIGDAASLLAQARAAAGRAGLPALVAEVEEARAGFVRPAPRRIEGGRERLVRLDEVAALLGADHLVVDACRRGVQIGGAWVPLTRRPVLFSLARALAYAWPGDADRTALITGAFNQRRPDETHRARLRVEIGRLRALLRSHARIEATARGFILVPHDARTVALLAPPLDGEQGALVALLNDGAAWSTSALALALGASQRTVQRALTALEAEGRARSIGRGRVQRWLAPSLAGFTTILLLPVAAPA